MEVTCYCEQIEIQELQWAWHGEDKEYVPYVTSVETSRNTQPTGPRIRWKVDIKLK
jgi:hypothetical protein